MAGAEHHYALMRAWLPLAPFAGDLESLGNCVGSLGGWRF